MRFDTVNIDGMNRWRSRPEEAIVAGTLTEEITQVRCGLYRQLSFVITEAADKSVCISVQGVFGMKEKKFIGKKLGVDLTQPPDYVKQKPKGEMWLFYPPKVH